MKKLTTLAAMAAFCAANAQVEVNTQLNTEVLTLPGGTQVSVENKVTTTTTTQVKVIEVPKPPVRQVRRTAIFIRNDSGAVIADNAMAMIRNQVRAQASKGDFEIISAEDALAAIRPMPDALQSADGVAQMRRYLNLQADLNRLQGNNSQLNLGGQGTTSDQRMAAQTSFVRLAQNLDADYILVLTIDGFEAEDFPNDNDPKKFWHKYTLDASYTLSDFSGYSIGGESFDVTLRYQKNTRLTDKSYPNDLSRDIAKRLADDMKKNAAKWRQSSLDKSMVPVSFDAQAMTMDNQPLYIQFDMTVGQVVGNDAQVPVRVAALVDIDGVTVGTTDCTVPLSPGLHKVRVWRQGMDDVNMTINARDGLKVNVPMRITEGEMLRIQELQQNIHRMTLQKETNQAIADMVRGKATMLRNSHIRIDADRLPETRVLYAPHVAPAANLINVNTVVPVQNTTIQQ